LEAVRAFIASQIELEALQKVTYNAFKLYVKTRGNPSAESVRRAKGETNITQLPFDSET